jgi:two-component system NtrC family sensor kinase
MLAEATRDASEAAAINTIAEESARCRAVAKNLLNFARQTEKPLTEFDFNALLRGVFDLRAYDLRSASIDIVTNLDEDLPPVVGEYGQIQQVVYNLVDNAYYAMEEAGGGVLEVTTWHQDGAIHLKVADSGPGINPDLIDRVFEPFVTTKPRGEGTGLGLSICRRILEDHEGTIIAHNRPGGGASFTATLPANDEMSAEVEPRQEEQTAESKPAQAVGTARVLFIDDEQSLCGLVGEFLKRRGHDVSVASTGEEGLEIALSDDFDVIICDMRLPGINGEDVCMSVLEEKPEMAQRIVVATGDILSPQTQKFFERTGLPHIHKPFTLEQLENAIAKLLAGEPVRDE